MAANTFQTRGPAICAHGAGFTPHGELSIKYRDLPTSPYPNETSEHIAGSADAEGLMSLRSRPARRPLGVQRATRVRGAHASAAGRNWGGGR